jgi:hypothetical protein
MAKPWEIDYGKVKAVEHEVKYGNERIKMLAIGLPLKNNKVLVYYEFSKPVCGIKSLAYLLSVNESRIKTEVVSVNGHVTAFDTCPQECSRDSDCPYYPVEECVMNCCEYDEVDLVCIGVCCGPCLPMCHQGPPYCVYCLVIHCPWCMVYEGCIECLEWGKTCEEAEWD